MMTGEEVPTFVWVRGHCAVGFSRTGLRYCMRARCGRPNSEEVGAGKRSWRKRAKCEILRFRTRCGCAWGNWGEEPGSEAEVLCGLYVCGSVRSGWCGHGSSASAPGSAELFGTRLMITWELQNHLSALFAKVDSYFFCACAPKDPSPAVKGVLIRLCNTGEVCLRSSVLVFSQILFSFRHRTSDLCLASFHAKLHRPLSVMFANLETWLSSSSFK